MRRAFYSLLALVALVAVIAGALWYFSYGARTAPPGRAAVAGLEQPVEVAWNGAGVATVRADSAAGRYAALGYVHGTGRPWLVSLWRQTATGRLGEWYGDNTLPLDRLTRRLGFGELARQAYAGLPEDQKALLRAYANGMNAALDGRAAENQNEFALLGHTPEPWQPWHTLAVERLYAYLASSPPAPDSLRQQGAPLAARRFLRADSTLRRWLHLHDFDRSAAWAVRSESGAAHLFYRHVYGSSAVPLLQAVLFERGDAGDVAALSLPGTPFLVAGRAGAQAWALLPGGSLAVERAPYDTSAAASYERVLGTDGRERLVRVRRSPDGLLLSKWTPPDSSARPASPPDSLGRRPAAFAGQDSTAADSARVDSLWQVRWAGFRPVTDLASWQALAEGASGGTGDGASGGFQLLRAGGLTADSSGNFGRFGTPERTVQFDGGLVAGPADWTPFLAEQVQARLRQAARDSPDAVLSPTSWMEADSSTWAGRLAPDMLASVDSLSRTRRGTFSYEERTDLFGQAIRYLRNWDYAYDRASIGASIFDTWVALYRDETGRLPVARASVDSLAASDSLRSIEDRQRFQLLGDAVSRLARRFGDDIEEWRWETVAPDTRHFPGWADSLSGRRLQTMAATRYAPIKIPGGGHPSTLDYGPSPISPGLPAPAGYEAWIGSDAWQTLFVRRRRFDTGTPFGRYRAQRSLPDPLPLRFGSEARRVTTLTPAGTTATGPVRAQF